MKNNRKRRRGTIAIAFGIGLLVTSFCSTNTLIVILSLVIICLGCSAAHC